MDKKLFNKIYASFAKKDYFYNKQFIKNRITEYKKIYPDIKIKLSDIKFYLMDKKIKTYKMIMERINEYKNGKKYPQREVFTWQCINAIKKMEAKNAKIIQL